MGKDNIVSLCDYRAQKKAEIKEFLIGLDISEKKDVFCPPTTRWFHSKEAYFFAEYKKMGSALSAILSVLFAIGLYFVLRRMEFTVFDIALVATLICGFFFTASLSYLNDLERLSVITLKSIEGLWSNPAERELRVRAFYKIVNTKVLNTELKHKVYMRSLIYSVTMIVSVEFLDAAISINLGEPAGLVGIVIPSSAAVGVLLAIALIFVEAIVTYHYKKAHRDSVEEYLRAYQKMAKYA